MTDAPQGPGWWQASDGMWYPPHTQYPPPPHAPHPGYGVTPPGWVAPVTSGLAIESLVLSIKQAKGRRATGYITFEITKGTAPSSIEYSGAFFHAYQWALK
jgi:hypothetical protein